MTALILLAALALRLVAMLFSPLEYDEIWSLENFSGLSVTRIFTDLALPNNHPLNSLFVKLWTVFVTQAQLIRIHSFAFGMCSVVLTGVLALGLFRSRSAALWSMFFMAFSAPAVAYSGLARGYSPQLAFLLLFACGLAWSGKLRRFVPGKFVPEAAMILGAVGAVLSVPSAPIFLAAATAAGAVNTRKLPKRSVAVALGIAAAAVAGYLAWNFSALREAQNWGRPLGSFLDWERFALDTTAKFVSLAALLPIVLGVSFDRRRSLPLWLGYVLILASAAVFRAGPERAYLPLCAIVALSCGHGTRVALLRTALRRGRLAVRGAAMLAVLLGYGNCELLAKRWAVTDYWGWFNSAQLEPETTFIVFPAAEGYPLCWNNRPELPRDYLRRLVCDAPGERTLLSFSAPGRISGMRPDGSEVEVALPVSGKPGSVGGRAAYFYRLVPLAGTPKPGDALLLALPPVPENDLRLLLNFLHAQQIPFVSLNPFFNYPLSSARGVLRSRMLLVSVPERPVDWTVARGTGGRLYRFVEMSGPGS